jgi:large subunit ribosomal protein L17
MKRGNIRKFGREKAQREALFKSLATALIEHGRIKTTKAKAKSLSSHTDKLVTIAKKKTLASRRALGSELGPAAVKKLADDIAPRFSDRSGGYTRVIPLDRRKSDGSEMALIEFTA